MLNSGLSNGKSESQKNNFIIKCFSEVVVDFKKPISRKDLSLKKCMFKDAKVPIKPLRSALTCSGTVWGRVGTKQLCFLLSSCCISARKKRHPTST